MTIRRAPAGGYSFGAKRQYRREVWSLIRQLVVAPREAHVLLMPSIEGDEIDVALSKGFRQNHLHVVDRNPAIVATIKRRYPLVNTYGADAHKALFRIEASGVRLAAANLDLTGKLSDATATELVRCSLANAFHNGALVFVTLMRGREDSEWFRGDGGVATWRADERWRDGLSVPAHQFGLSDNDLSRVADLRFLLTRAGGEYFPVKCGRYQSSQPMMWVAFQRIDGDSLEQVANDIEVERGPELSVPGFAQEAKRIKIGQQARTNMRAIVAASGIESVAIRLEEGYLCVYVDGVNRSAANKTRWLALKGLAGAGRISAGVSAASGPVPVASEK